MRDKVQEQIRRRIIRQGHKKVYSMFLRKIKKSTNNEELS